MAKEERVKPKETGVRGVVLLAVAAVGATLALFFATRAKAAPPPGVYVCPYCGATFATFEELVAHVQSVHPGERLPVIVVWE